MASQPIFFKKSVCDYSNEGVVATASQGNNTAQYVLNRSNTTAWLTTGSVDADNPTLEIDFGDTYEIACVLLVEHNFKSFKIEYWNGSAYADFSTPIDETNCLDTTSFFEFTALYTRKLRLTVRGTKVANEDKRLYQLITTSRIGQLDCWPVINDPTINRNKRETVMLSGKTTMSQNVGGYSCELQVKTLKNSADLAIIEALYDSYEGFLFWPCGGDEDQFSSKRQGYRKQDIYFVRTRGNYVPEWYRGFYAGGMPMKMKLVEVVD